MRRRPTRRDLLKGSAALALSAASTRVLAAAPPPTAITPELIAAARKEGKVVYYTSVDLPMAERIAKAFEAKFSGIAVRVERTGAERLFQRIGQEYASRIHAVDVVNSSDAAHFIVWKRDGILAPFVPEDVAKHYAAEHKDGDGQFAAFRLMLSVIGYQHQHGQARGRAQEPRRPARSEMEGQDRQGASGLQRHDHDRDPADRPRPRLVVPGKARAAGRHAGAVGVRPAEEARARRARRAGRRQRIQSDPAQGGRPAGRADLCRRGHAGDHRAERRVQERAEPECGAAVPELVLHAGVPAAHHRRRRPALAASAGEGEAGPQALQGDQDLEGGSGGGREAERRDQSPLQSKYSKSEGARHARSQLHPTRRPEGRDRACRRHTVRRADPRPGAGAGRDHAGADRGGQEGGQARLLHRDGPRLRAAPRQGVRGQVRHRGSRRAFRRRAGVHPHRPGVHRQHPRGRRRQHRRRRPLHRLDAQRLARALSAGGGRPALRQGVLRSERPSHHHAHPGVADRLQHQPGEEGGGAEELRRPARSEVGGQDGEGPSGLQRHHHERHLPDRARHRLGLFREARQAARHAGAVGDRHAEEDSARRARRDGRRRGLPGDPLQGGGLAARGGLSGGGHADGRRSERRVQGRAQPERRQAVPELDAFARGPAVPGRLGAAVFGRTARPWRSRACGRCATSS